jgi:choice-of-anchor A domain-containing protein
MQNSTLKLFFGAMLGSLLISNASANITGRVVCDDGNGNITGLPNITVTAPCATPTTTTTDADGNYRFIEVASGMCEVSVAVPANCVGNRVLTIIVTDSAENRGVDFHFTGCCGPICTGKIGDFVWQDTNGNGCQDAGEPGIPGAKVDLYAGCGANVVLIKSTTTDANGKYLFEGLCAGQYTVGFNTPSGYSPTLANQACNVGGKPADETDSDCDCAGGTPCGICVTLPADNSENLTIDCGYIPKGCPECVDPDLGLGAAAGCTVLQLGASKVSITGPAGGIHGDICIAANGSLSMSGDEYVTGTVNLGPGAKFSNSSHSSVNVVQNVDLTAQINAANAAAANAAGLACDQAYVKLDGKAFDTITGGVGINVICVGDVVLGGKQIFLTGPVGAKFIINVTGKFTLTGGGAGPQIRATGGVQPKDVLYNIIGAGADVAFSGGGGGVDCCAAIVDGTLLAPSRKISLSPGLVNGQIISGKDISIVSGSSVRCPPCP